MSLIGLVESQREVSSRVRLIKNVIESILFYLNRREERPPREREDRSREDRERRDERAADKPRDDSGWRSAPRDRDPERDRYVPNDIQF